MGKKLRTFSYSPALCSTCSRCSFGDYYKFCKGQRELKLKRGGVAKAKEVTEKDGVAVAAHWPLFSMRFAWLVGKVHEAF